MTIDTKYIHRCDIENTILYFSDKMIQLPISAFLRCLAFLEDVREKDMSFFYDLLTIKPQVIIILIHSAVS